MRQYVLVDSESVYIQTYMRTPENDWLLHIEADQTKKVKIGDCEIQLSDIYNRVGFWIFSEISCSQIYDIISYYDSNWSNDSKCDEKEFKCICNNCFELKNNVNLLSNTHAIIKNSIKNYKNYQELNYCFNTLPITLQKKNISPLAAIECKFHLCFLLDSTFFS